MMRSLSLVSLLAGAASAFPGMPTRLDMARAAHEGRDLSSLFDKVGSVAAGVGSTVNVGTANTQGSDALPDIVSDLVGGLAGTIEGLLGSVAEGVLNPDNKRPEEGYEFREPGPDDSRGPCPGLNLLANYGYLPRNGTVTFGQVVEATARGFNMGPDLSALLSTFAVLTDGDIVTESWNLGEGFGGLGGLNRHSTVEADVSPNREDYYNGCGDAHHLSSRLFKQNVQAAKDSGTNDFGLKTMGRQFALTAAFAKNYNPYLYYFPFPSIVSFAAFAFYPQFFSNGTYGLGGVANYESISSIIGAKYSKEDDAFIYVPERWPENWYRRSFPYTTVQALTEGLVYIYSQNPIAMPVAQLGTPNLNATTFLCNVYQGLNSITPLGLAGTAEEIEAKATWAIAKLDPYFKDTILGCPTSTISQNFLFPPENGGPLAPPPAVVANAGDNVYNRIYFKEAPQQPNCNAASDPKSGGSDAAAPAPEGK